MNNLVNEINDKFKKQYSKVNNRIVICGGTGCIAGGSMEVYKAFQEEYKKRGLDYCVEITDSCREKSTYISKIGCQRFCAQGHLVRLGDLFYRKVTPDDVPAILERTVLKG